LRGAGAACFIAEEKVVVSLNDLATVLASQVKRTAAVKVIDKIDAAGGQWTSTWHALDNVLFAVATRETVGANALIAASIVNACGTVLAHSNSTSVKLVLATDADVIGTASAVETRAKVAALAVVHTRVTNATVGRSFAAFAIRTRRAGTEEVA
jgi:hypothetical protein